jgi:hypothetical protein
MGHGKAFIEIYALKEAVLSLIGPSERLQDEAMIKVKCGVQGLNGKSLPAERIGCGEIAGVGLRFDLGQRGARSLGGRRRSQCLGTSCCRR